MKGQTSIFLTLSFLNIKIFNMGMTDEEHLLKKKNLWWPFFLAQEGKVTWENELMDQQGSKSFLS